MLTSISSFSRNETWKATAEFISGFNWLTVGNDGQGVVMTAGSPTTGVAPSPPDYLLMSYGACLGAVTKFLLEKSGKTFKNLKVEVEGDWSDKPQSRISECRAKIKLNSDVSEEELKKILKMAESKICPVAGTLALPVKLSSSFEIEHL